MTSQRVPAPVFFLFSVAAACYSPVNTATTGNADDGGSTFGESDTDSPTSGATATSDPTATSSNPTDTDDTDTNPGTTVDSTGDSGGEAVCGNGMVEGDEVCDDGVNDGSYDGCTADCTALGPHCGDGEEQEDEVCDDGDQTNGNGCNVDCIVSGTALWTQTREGLFATAVGVDADDGVLVGTTNSSLLYFDAEGEMGWTGSYNYPAGSSDIIASVDFHEERGWIVAGRATTEANGTDVWWRFYGEGGVPGAATTFDNPGHSSDTSGGAAFDGAGRLYVAGSSDINDNYNVWLRKFDLDGDEMWTQPFDGGGDDFAGAIAVGGDDYIVIGGMLDVDGSGRDAYLRKYSPEGGLQWHVESAGAGTSADRINDVAVGADGTVAAVGNHSDDIWIGVYDADGNEQWSDTYDGASENDCASGQFCFLGDGGNGIAVDSSGAVIVAGNEVDLTDDGGDANSIWVRKYDPNGSELWTDIQVGQTNAIFQGAFDVTVTSVDDIVVVGVLDESPSGGESLLWVQKYAP